MTIKKIVATLGGYFTQKGKSLALTLKESPRTLGMYLVALNAMFQLATSQTHIAALVRLKLTVSTPGAQNYTAGMPSIGIGLFFFSFILFGLVALFTATRMTDKKTTVFAIIATLIAIVFGLIFVLKMSNPDSIVKQSDVQAGINLMVVGIAVYALGIGLFIKDLFTHKDDQYGH